MSQVSIGDVDNLKDAYDALSACLCSAKETFQSDTSELLSLSGEIADALESAIRALEEARELEEQRKERLEEFRVEIEEAKDNLDRAESELSQAESNLSAARSDVEYDEAGDAIEPDTSAEEDAVAAAEADVDTCRQALSEATSRFEEAERCLSEATDRRRKCEENHEISYANDMKVRQLNESFCVSQHAGLASVEHQVAVAASRLQRAQQALEQYLAANPAEAAFATWVHWQPVAGHPVTPSDIHDRLHLSLERQSQLARYLYNRDPVFRRKINEYRDRFGAAKGGAERSAVLVQASRGGSGDLAERMVKFAFAPIGTVSTQDRRYFEDGRYTKIDLVVKGLKNPVILGKGSGMGAPVGGSLAVEVKTGHPEYLYNQRAHMTFQAGGHQDSSASITICSGDIHDLSDEKERELREAMRDAGSPIVGMLPRKDDIDATLWNLICKEGMGRNESSGSSI